MTVRYLLPACAAVLAFAAPATAQDAAPAPVAASAPAPDPWAAQRASFERARTGWIGECRRRYVSTYAPRHNDPGLAGLLLGGVVGGLAGYGIAGPGDRALGTVAGATVGAIAGNAIERSGRKGRRAREAAALLDEATEYCTGYFDYETQGALQPIAAPAPPPPPEPKCHEEVTYEDVDVPVHHRHIPPRPRRDKRQPMD